jgi:hypothetical protein
MNANFVTAPIQKAKPRINAKVEYFRFPKIFVKGFACWIDDMDDGGSSGNSF